MNTTLADLHILDAPFVADAAYTYRVPAEFCPLEAGRIVTVPFGRGDRVTLALVRRFYEGEDSALYKSVLSVSSDLCTLDDEMLQLCDYMKEQTFCSVGEAVHAMLPTRVLTKIEEFYVLSPEAGSKALKSLPNSLLVLYRFIEAQGQVSLRTLKARFGAGVGEKLAKLRTLGWVVRLAESSETGVKKKTFYSLALPDDQNAALLDGEKIEGMRRPLSEKQRRVLELLVNAGTSMRADELARASGCGKPQFDSLTGYGILTAEEREIVEDPFADAEEEEKDPHELVLNDAQNRVYASLREMVESPEARAALLYGVTGSGKTSVMMKTIDFVLSRGEGAILLLPEIALTPQTVGIFRRRYGRDVAVLHSGLSDAERGAMYGLIRRGGARVVIGTRSAVFAPVRNLGLIIIDEEQEHTYKSDSSPRYHARDVARFRAAFHRGLLLLASATPSLESFEKAKAGKYALLTLTERYGNARLPEVKIVDMREEIKEGNTSPLGRELLTALLQTFKRGEQSILFLNRRGYHNFIGCKSCGEVITCPQCSVSLTYHTDRRSFESGYLCCHLCGYRTALPKVCPSCGSSHLGHNGYGTQKIEEELTRLLPDARILRMDADSTGSKSAYENLLGRFRRREADILLGTQMVTKGHDFPDVTLVGVLSADSSLYLDDYRASERTFSLLTQVIGRAGRAEKPGGAVIQTNNPDSDVIGLACAQDYEAFFAREIRLRNLLAFPPYCDMVLLTVTHTEERELQAAVVALRRRLDELTAGEFADVRTVLFGPFEAPIYRMEGKYRMRIVLKCRLNKRSRALLARLCTDFPLSCSKRAALAVDCNPSVL